MKQAHKNFRNGVLFVIVIAILIGLYFGAYLPFVKAELYMIKSRELGSNRYESPNELMQNYDEVFSYYSPLGHEETINFFISDILTIISQIEQPEEIALPLVEYVESHILEGNVLHQLHMGHLYLRLGERFGKEEYFQMSEEYYKNVLVKAPRLPHALEPLFSMYQRTGQMDKMQDISSRISELWPDHPLIAETK